MKYLQDYKEQETTALFERLGVFFAFGNKQIEEGLAKIKKQGVLIEGEKVSSLGNGIFVPKKNKGQFLKDMEAIHKTGIASDIAENGIPAIIKRELGNHEAQITGDIQRTFESLDGYEITLEQVEAAYRPYYAECVKNNWF